jgi:hypothetical protein
VYLEHVYVRSTTADLDWMNFETKIRLLSLEERRDKRCRVRIALCGVDTVFYLGHTEDVQRRYVDAYEAV